MQLFHLGYPKSGSTTIQELLKRGLGDRFLGKPYRSRVAEYHVRESLVFADLRQLPVWRLAEMRDAICTGQPVISDEILSGVGLAHGLAANSLLQIVDNLDILTDGGFVAHVVFRRPADFLRSYYGQMVRMGARLSFDQFCSLVLLRRHHWLFRALDYGSILRSPACQSRRLRPVLFETLFHDAQLANYMKQNFGVERMPEQPTARRANRSEPDAVLDRSAALFPLNPASWLELSVVQPSIQEHLWIDRLADAERDHHKSLWVDQREEGFRLEREQTRILLESRDVTAGDSRKRPVSDTFQQLLSAIGETNAGVVEDFPELQFTRHDYFV